MEGSSPALFGFSSTFSNNPKCHEFFLELDEEQFERAIIVFIFFLVYGGIFASALWMILL